MWTICYSSTYPKFDGVETGANFLKSLPADSATDLGTRRRLDLCRPAERFRRLTEEPVAILNGLPLFGVILRLTGNI